MKTIVIADDAQFMRMMIRKIVTDAFGNNIQIIEAVNGKDAFEKYKLFHPDVVTMDITMPECSGLEGLNLIKEYDPDANIIMITAMGQQSMVLNAIQGGAKDFIVKPFKNDAIIEKLTPYIV